MKIIGGAIVLFIAVWLYVVSTKMINKDRKNSETGCCGNCSGCNDTECMHDKSKTRD